MNIFIAFANQDRDVRDKLLRQMNLIKDRQGWNIWSAKEIKAGEKWDAEIQQRLLDSEVVILLLSTDFFNSRYIVEAELPEIVAKHKNGNCHIIPIIAHICHWKDTAFGEYAQLGDIQALPVGEYPIVSRGHWDNDAQPYFETVQGIRDSIQTFQNKKGEKAVAAERAEQVRLETEQRTRDEQTRREREATERADNERLAQRRREQEQAARRAEHTAWQQAADAHQLPAYEDYMARYPQGEYAREARFRIKELKQKVARPVTWGRYALMGVGVVVLLLLAYWLVPMMYIGEKTQTAHTQPTPLDTPRTRPTTSDNFKKDSTVSSSSVEIERPTEGKPVQTEKAPAPSVAFNYPTVRVAGGTFQMGSPASEVGRYSDECQHTVTVSSFSMGKYEVTQAQWKAIMGSNPSKFKNCDDCPVEQVSWNDVQSFIKKLKDKTGNTYRLPTEAEWEYAARGGTKSRGYTYAGSNTLGSVAWYNDNSGSKTHPVGSKSPNELGLYDMSGNVWEWCQDTWKPYPGCSGDPDPRSRVLRGGGWDGNAPGCRAAHRGDDEPSSRASRVGFRLVSVSLQ